MTESGKSRNDFPLETSVPGGAVPLESILCTEELHRHPARENHFRSILYIRA
jgi:hypothetical protein